MKIVALDKKETYFTLGIIAAFIVGIIIGACVGSHHRGRYSYQNSGRGMMGWGGYSERGFGGSYVPMMGGRVINSATRVNVTTIGTSSAPTPAPAAGTY